MIITKYTNNATIQLVRSVDELSVGIDSTK